jgi:hypothetical protein
LNPSRPAHRYTYRAIPVSTDWGGGASYENQKVKINGSFESVENIKYLGTAATNENSIHEEIDSRYNSHNATIQLRIVCVLCCLKAQIKKKSYNSALTGLKLGI